MSISASSVPTVIAQRYRLGEALGRGGMAEVRAGTDLRLQRPVAVKFLLPEMAARDDIRRRFEAEARSAASLTDPHAVAVYDTGEHDGTPYIVMERLPGETLADRIAAGPVDPRWLRQISCEVLGALASAHVGGMVHRDVKPGNILLTTDGHAKIADFGIAKSLEDSAGSLDLTGTGQLLGTPAYLAPERLDGAPAAPRSDIYSLGVVLYEALSGTRPFPGDTPLAVARAVALGQYRPLGEVRPGLDPALVAAVERAMARDPDRRFASATAMAEALAPPTPTAPVTAGEPTLLDAPRGPATSILDLADLPPAAEAEVAEAAALPVPVARPRGRVAVALLATVIFAALLLAGLRSRGDSSGTSTAATTATTSAPTASTAAPTLADQLRAAAGRLGPADGPRSGDLAAALRQVADQTDAGGGGPAATSAIISAGAWHLTGQLTDAATASAINLLSQVPGVTVVTLPSLSGILGPGATAPPAPAPAPGPAPGNGKAKGKKD